MIAFTFRLNDAGRCTALKAGKVYKDVPLIVNAETPEGAKLVIIEKMKRLHGVSFSESHLERVQ